jgi:hypothetical protein
MAENEPLEMLFETLDRCQTPMLLRGEPDIMDNSFPTPKISCTQQQSSPIYILHPAECATDWPAYRLWKGASGLARLKDLAGPAKVQVQSVLGFFVVGNCVCGGKIGEGEGKIF